MVTLNTDRQTRIISSLQIKYLLEVPKCDCLFTSTIDARSGRTKLFLIFHDNGKIYTRHGLKGTWIELRSKDEHHEIRQLVLAAIRNKSVPCYKTTSLDLLK